MKSSRSIFLLIPLSIYVIFFLFSCRKIQPNPTSLPAVATNPVSAITQVSAKCGGTVTSEGGLPVTARGVCWSTDPAPTTASSKTSDSAGPGAFTSNLTGLTPNTLIYVRAYAVNSRGTAYGEERSFTTLEPTPETVTDIDGNVYHTVTIGAQVWLKENLKAVRYNKGDSIPEVEDGLSWNNLKKGAFCNYDKDPANADAYGRLYNWYTLNDTQNPCPVGWHVPSDIEWQALIDFLGGDLVAGGKLKATGTLGQGTGLWKNPNTEATNESGFSALPGGFRNFDGSFSSLSENAFFWSSTTDQTFAWNRVLSYKYGNIDRYSRNKANGYSIRCIKDK